MAIYAIILEEPITPQGEYAIQSVYPDAYKVREGVFLVHSEDIAQDIAIAVGIKTKDDGSNMSGVVFKLNGSYSGYAARAMWDWLRQKEAMPR